jgi:L-alanine-DL-glutamate epimerase-like enolase superfamily enzyme
VKIRRLETFVKGQIGLVRVTTDDGKEGWGQLSPFNADITAIVFHRQVARYALGADPLDTETLSDRVIEAEYKYPGSYVCRGLCGLDTALWDLRGRIERKPVAELLGGKCRAMKLYGSSMRRDIKPEDEAARLVKLRDSLGYKAFKIRIGKVCGHDVDEWPGRTDALVPACRKAVGKDVVVLVDGNSCYTPKRAIEVGRMLEANDIGHFEEPCPYWEIEWTAEVAAALKVPVAGGEQDCDLAQWRRMINMHAVDIVQPDICYVGGLTRAMRVARMAAEKGLPCVPHSANLSMVTIFTLHMMAAIPNAGPHIEYCIEPDEWISGPEGLYRPVLEVKNGTVMVPEGPGWGVEPNKAWLEKAARQASE